MLARAKKLALDGARHTGVEWLLGSSRWRRERLQILCYHGVSIADEHLWNPAMYVTPQRLDERIVALKEYGAHILPLDEAVRRLAARSLPPKSVAITFDDGAADFRLRALPVLEAHGVPATVYLTTYYVQRAGVPVWNMFASYVMWLAKDHPDMLEDSELLGSGRFDLSTESGRSEAHAAFMRRWVGGTTGEKDAAVEALGVRLGLDMDSVRRGRHLQLMTPQEVSDLPRDLISVELHTHRHRTPLSRIEFQRELRENAAIIEELTGRRARHFCYPSGHARPEFLDWLRSDDVLSATTCVPGIASVSDEPLLLPRLVDTMETPATTFRGWVAGTAAFLPGRTRTLAEVR